MDPITIALGLAQFAPTIMRFFGAGEKSTAVAEKVVQIAQGVTGTKTPEEALAAMRENAQFAQQFNMAVLEADTKLEEAFLADKKDARARDVEVRKLTGGTNHRPDIMLVGAFLGVIAISFLFALRPDLSADARTFLATAGGMLIMKIGTAFDFEFGSSRSSRDKDEMMVKAYKNGAG